VTVLEKELIGVTDSSFRDLVVPGEAQRKFHRKALKVLARQCSDPVTHAEEVVQQAKLQFIQASRNRLSDYNDPVAAMCTAVCRVALTHLKKCRQEVAVDFSGPSSMQAEYDQTFNARDRLALKRPFNPIEMWNRTLEIKEKLRHVSDQDLFISFYVEGWTPTEIAEKRRWGRSRVSRALKRLKRELGITETSSNAETHEELSQKVNRIMKTERRLKWANTGGVPS